MSSTASGDEGPLTYPAPVSTDISPYLALSGEPEWPGAAETREQVSRIMSAHPSTFGNPKDWHISWVHDGGRSGNIAKKGRRGLFGIGKEGLLVVAMTADADSQVGTQTEKSGEKSRPLQIYETREDGTSRAIIRNPGAGETGQWSC